MNYRNEYKPVARSLGDTCILRNNVSPNDVSPMYRHIYGPAQVQTVIHLKLSACPKEDYQSTIIKECQCVMHIT